MSDFKQFRRTQIAEMADWIPGFDMARVSVSDADKEAGSPKAGDKIARNPANHADRWLVAADYFAANFEPMRPPITGELETVAWAHKDAPDFRHSISAKRKSEGWPRCALYTVALVKKSDALAHRDAIREALNKIADEGCQNFTSGNCYAQGRRDDALFGGDMACYPCRVDSIIRKYGVALLASPGTGEGR